MGWQNLAQRITIEEIIQIGIRKEGITVGFLSDSLDSENIVDALNRKIALSKQLDILGIKNIDQIHIDQSFIDPFLVHKTLIFPVGYAKYKDANKLHRCCFKFEANAKQDQVNIRDINIDIRVEIALALREIGVEVIDNYFDDSNHSHYIHIIPYNNYDIEKAYYAIKMVLNIYRVMVVALTVEPTIL